MHLHASVKNKDMWCAHVILEWPSSIQKPIPSQWRKTGPVHALQSVVFEVIYMTIVGQTLSQPLSFADLYHQDFTGNMFSSLQLA